MIAIDTRSDSPFAPSPTRPGGWWHGASNNANLLYFIWNNLVLAEKILELASDVPFDILYQTIEESTSHNVTEWIQEARQRAHIMQKPKPVRLPQPQVLPYEITCHCGRVIKGLRPSDLDIHVECEACGTRHFFPKGETQ